jgi:YbgC/YbaW family acyl-CoA thioester hydrolase
MGPPHDARGPVVATDRVRWSDVDPLGIIRYDTYVRLLEIGETELFRAAGFAYSLAETRMPVWLPRRRLGFEYHAPARLDDLLAVRAYVLRVGRTSLTLGFDFVDAASGAPRASAELVVVCVDRERLAPFPLPDELRRGVAPFVMTAAEVRAAAEGRVTGDE